MAQIQPITLVAPGRFGLNTERAKTLLAPEWATRMTNAVINRAGRVGFRKGWADQTTTGISGSYKIDVLFEYLQEDGTKTVISTANNKVYKDFSDFSDSGNDITSSTAPTADHWQFVNFNGSVIGVQRGHAPIEWAGTGDFADISFTGTGYDGNCICAAFGRVWAADADLQTVRYSTLLDHTDMSTSGGTIDMSSVWTTGMDQIVAIAAIGANLVVFGKNHIVLWADGSGSEIGIVPSQLEIVDTIEGTGCIARDSIAKTGEGDLLFLSRHGIQSLGRVIAEKSNPVVTLSKHVRKDLLDNVATQRASDAELDQVRACHSPEEGLYLLHLPVPDVTYVLDTQHPFPDEDQDIMFPVLKWELGGSIGGLLSRQNGDLLFGSSGVVGKYSGNLDDTSTYYFEMSTGWLDFGEANNILKILKELSVTIEVSTATTIRYYWEFDFDGTELSRNEVYSGGVSSEFNVAEFNIDEFAGGATLLRRRVPAFGEGQFLRLGVSATVNNFDFVLQQMTVAPKMGRMIA